MFDTFSFTAYLWRTPAAYTLYLRGLSFPRLALLYERRHALPDAHRDTLTTEYRWRMTRPWTEKGGWLE